MTTTYVYNYSLTAGGSEDDTDQGYITYQFKYSTWDGSTSTAWETPSNWRGNIIPTQGDLFDIPSVSSNTYPVITNDYTVSKVIIGVGASLGIANNGILRVDGSISAGSGIVAFGTLNNLGTLYLNNTPTYGLSVNGAGSTVNLYGETNIGDTGSIGSSAILVSNGGTLNIGNGTNTYSTVVNIGGGSNPIGLSGIEVTNGACNINSGSVNISNVTVYGITNQGTIVNNGEIYISDCDLDGIDLSSSFTFTNKGYIGINQQTNTTVEAGLDCSGSGNFKNEGGTIEIDRTESVGIIASGTVTFENISEGLIILGAQSADLGFRAISITGSATFTNGACAGLINKSADAISIFVSASFNNLGWIQNYASSASEITLNSGAILNLGTGTFTIGNGNAVSTTALTTWTGGSGNQDWNSVCNWDAGFPEESFEVIIADVGFFNPKIEEEITVKKMTIEAGGEVDIGTNGRLNIKGSANAGIFIEGTLNHSAGGDLYIDNVGGSALNINGANAIAYLRGNTYIGTNNPVTGGISVSNGGELVIGRFVGSLSDVSSAATLVRIDNITTANGISCFNGTVTIEEDLSATLVEIGTAGANSIARYGISIGNGGNFSLSAGQLKVADAGTGNPCVRVVGTGILKTSSGANLLITDGDTGLYNEGTFNNQGTTTIGNITSDALSNLGNVNNAGGILKIDGLMNGVSSLAGTLAPGNSTGITTTNTGLNLSAADLEIEVNGTSAITEHDVLQINGDVTLGGTLTVDYNYSIGLPGERIVFLRYTGNRTDEFTLSGSSPDPFDGWVVDYSVDGEVALVTSTAVNLNLKFFLQGAYNATSGLMNTALKDLAEFPMTDNGYTIEDGVLAQTGNQALVDWVTVELRNATDSTKVEISRPALLLADGSIVDKDGSSAVLLHGLTKTAYYIAVRHKNHLGIMSEKPLFLVF